MIIDCIGCLHGARPQLKGGDLLIITGDLTKSDKPSQYDDFLWWLNDQPYSKKVLIAGNHDNTFQTAEPSFFDYISDYKIDYLCDSGTEFEGLKIWGSPWTTQFKGINPKCCAFTLPIPSREGDGLMDKWDLIPQDTDILITHTPPFGVLDGIPIDDGSLFHAGSTSLYGWLRYVGRPRLHAFSHIHEAYGRKEHFPTYDNKMMISVNCSTMNKRYRPVNKPIRVKL